MKLAVVIFRNNLRIHDNYSLYHACSEHDFVLGLYSQELLEGFEFGFKKCDVFREKLIKESLLNLQKNLLKYDINLSIVDDINKALEKLANSYEIEVYFDQEVGTQEFEFEKKLKKYKHKSYFSQTLIEPFSFNFENSFTGFRKKAEALEIKECLPNISKKQSVYFESLDIKIPKTDISNKYAITFKGGENEAIKQLQNYLPKIHEYKSTRNEMSGFENSTKFSPYLAIGSISPRFIYHEIKKQESKTFESDSSYWIYFELLWRDFFYLVMKQSGNKLFLKTGLKGIKYKFKKDKKALENFLNANTGVDLIDASIKELKTTGWLSNRNRQIVASYFVKNLGLDWRIGAAFFESILVDYNPASNYGNWAYQAHVGNDKTYRIFDPLKQSKMYNGDDYVFKWLGINKGEARVKYWEMASKVKKEVFFEED